MSAWSLQTVNSLLECISAMTRCSVLSYRTRANSEFQQQRRQRSIWMQQSPAGVAVAVTVLQAALPTPTCCILSMCTSIVLPERATESLGGGVDSTWSTWEVAREAKHMVEFRCLGSVTFCSRFSMGRNIFRTGERNKTWILSGRSTELNLWHLDFN